MLTSSLTCTSSPASAAITSFAFMFELVPEPVWKTSIGNWSSSSPSATRSAAAAMRAALSSSRRPSSPFTRAAAALIRPSQRATGTGIGSPETGKLATALRVSPPQSSVVGVELLTPASVVTAPRSRRRSDGVSARLAVELDVPAAKLDGTAPETAAEGLAQVVRGRPAEVVAARALARLTLDDALVATGKALDPAFHVAGVSTPVSKRLSLTRGTVHRTTQKSSEQ